MMHIITSGTNHTQAVFGLRSVMPDIALETNIAKGKTDGKTYAGRIFLAKVKNISGVPPQSSRNNDSGLLTFLPCQFLQQTNNIGGTAALAVPPAALHQFYGTIVLSLFRNTILHTAKNNSSVADAWTP
jgi:hypothetical protein